MGKRFSLLFGVWINVTIYFYNFLCRLRRSEGLTFVYGSPYNFRIVV